MYKKNFKDFCYGMSTKKGALNESKVAKTKITIKESSLLDQLTAYILVVDVCIQFMS